jgi:flagellar biosynthesis/type III secretory pathway M-ring protein FliF/YscJ
MEGELAQSIMAMDAVTSATVHLAIPESTVFSDSEVLTSVPMSALFLTIWISFFLRVE